MRKKNSKGKFLWSIFGGIGMILNPVLVTIPFIICWFQYYAVRLPSPFHFWGNWTVVSLFFFLYALFSNLYDSYLVSLSKVSELIYSQVISVVLTDLILYITTILLMRRLPNPSPLLAAFIGQGILITLWCGIAHVLYFSQHPPEKTAIVYSIRQDVDEMIQRYRLGKRFDVKLFGAGKRKSFRFCR